MLSWQYIKMDRLMKLSLSLRRKLMSVCLATGVFVLLAAFMAGTIDVPMENAVLGGLLFGIAVSCFEEFYVQVNVGRHIRAMHPVKAVLIYALVICLIFFAVQHLIHFFLGRLDELPEAYARLPVTIPMVFGASLASVLALRVIGFIGAKTLFHLLIGRYHRPVVEEKVFLFLDMRKSTAFVAALGAVRAKELIGKFLFDLSKPITDHQGEIYLYTGDGLIAMWDWPNAMADRNIVRTVDAIRQTMERESAHYNAIFGRVPEYRIGIHGGEVAISEQGDAKRAIGVYGETINIAARMEQAAKSLGETCVVSEAVVAGLAGRTDGFTVIGAEPVKGISRPVTIYRYAGV